MRRQLVFALTTATAAIAGAMPAAAVPVVNTYQTISRFATGPIAQVTSIFTLSFDPSVTSGPATVTSYSSSSGNAAFNPALVQFTSTGPTQAEPNSFVIVGGSSAGPSGFAPGVADFSIQFNAGSQLGGVPTSNPLIPFYAATTYQLAGSCVQTSTFDVTISLLSSAVPEPTTWGMMILGVGAVGAASRRRKRASTGVAFS